MSKPDKYLLARNYIDDEYADFGEFSLIELDESVIQEITTLASTFFEAYRDVEDADKVPSRIVFYREYHLIVSASYKTGKAWNYITDLVEYDQFLPVHIKKEKFRYSFYPNEDNEEAPILQERNDVSRINIYKDGYVIFCGIVKHTDINFSTPDIHINTLREFAGLDRIEALDAPLE